MELIIGVVCFYVALMVISLTGMTIMGIIMAFIRIISPSEYRKIMGRERN